MSRFLLTGALILFGFGTLFAWLFRPPGDPGVPQTLSTSTATASSADVQRAPNPARPVEPTAASPPAASPGTPIGVAPVVSPRARLAREFETAKDLKALYDSLAASADPESRYYAAKALQECMDQRRTTQVEKLRQDVATRVTETDPTYAQRQAALGRLSENRCQGFSESQLTDTYYRQMLNEAAAQGSNAARVANLILQIQQRIVPSLETRQRTATMTGEELSTLRDALNSGDPEALRRLGNAWTLWQRAEGMHVGTNQETVNMPAWNAAWNLLSCDQGAYCGGDTRALDMQCASLGYCGATDFNAFLQQYGLSPHQYQLAINYRETIRAAINQQQWNLIGLGSPPTITLPGGRTTQPTPPPPPRKRLQSIFASSENSSLPHDEAPPLPASSEFPQQIAEAPQSAPESE